MSGFASDPKEYEGIRDAIIAANTAEEKFERRQHMKGELETLLHISQQFGGISGCAEDVEFYKVCWLPDKTWEGWLIDWCSKFRKAQTKWRKDACVRELRQEW